MTNVIFKIRIIYKTYIIFDIWIFFNNLVYRIFQLIFSNSPRYKHFESFTCQIFKSRQRTLVFKNRSDNTKIPYTFCKRDYLDIAFAINIICHNTIIVWEWFSYTLIRDNKTIYFSFCALIYKPLQGWINRLCIVLYKI